MTAFKRLSLALGLRGGMFRLVQLAFWHRKSAILTFHRFSGAGEGARHGLRVERLDEYMRYLTRH